MAGPLADELIDRVRMGLEREDLPAGVRPALSVDDGEGLIVMSLTLGGVSVCDSYQAIEFLELSVEDAGGLEALSRRHIGNLMAELDEYMQGAG